jgi:hypothetical protein
LVDWLVARQVEDLDDTLAVDYLVHIWAVRLVVLLDDKMAALKVFLRVVCWDEKWVT